MWLSLQLMLLSLAAASLDPLDVISDEIRSLQAQVTEAKVTLKEQAEVHERTMAGLHAELKAEAGGLGQEEADVTVYDGQLFDGPGELPPPPPRRGARSASYEEFAVVRARPSTQKTYSNGQVIEINSAEYDWPVEGQLNNETGAYMYPHTGFYKVYLYMYQVFNEQMTIDLRRGSIESSVRILTMNIPPNKMQAGVVVAIRCDEGQEVFVRAFADTFRVGPDSAILGIHWLHSDLE